MHGSGKNCLYFGCISQQANYRLKIEFINLCWLLIARFGKILYNSVDLIPCWKVQQI